MSDNDDATPSRDGLRWRPLDYRDSSLWWLLNSLPKADLHVHLTGCARISTIRELLHSHGVAVEGHRGPDIQDVLSFDSPAPSYSDSFAPWRLILNRLTHLPGVLPRLARELAEDLARDGVVYAEVRVSPRLIHFDGRLPATLSELDGERRRCRERFGVDMRWILGFTREFFSRSDLQTQRRVTDEILEAAAPYQGNGIVGFDLWGDESSASPAQFAEAFGRVSAAGYPLTIHTGEVAPPSDIEEAVLHLRAARIGHAVTAQQSSPTRALLRDSGVAVETCLTSNWVTGATRDIASHAMRPMLDDGVAVVLSTDNRSTHRTDLTSEYVMALGLGLLKPQELAQMLVAPSHHAFCDDETRARLGVQLGAAAGPQLAEDVATFMERDLTTLTTT